jgi:hypothetical protein
MDKRSVFLLAGICALTVGGCGTEDTATAPSPSPVASGSPTVSPNAAQPFAAAPLVAAQDKTKKATQDKTPRVPGLLQATDPKQRAKEVQAGINSRKEKKDPFASLPPLISLRTPSGASGLPAPERPPGSAVPNFPTTGPGTGAGTTGAGTRNTPKRPAGIPNFPQAVATASPPSIQPIPGRNPGAVGVGLPGRGNIPNIIPALPPLPDPTLAKAVEVTGVVVIAGVPQAIVKAPNESTSRYVQAGQRLSNGQVLVKRIEVNSGSDPVVVLEQNGVEVGRAVGDKATPTTPGGGPAAFAPDQFGVRG